MPAALQLEDIATLEESEPKLHYWEKLLQVSHRDPIDGTDLTNRNLLNSLNTTIEGSAQMEKLKSLRDSIPEIKSKLGVIQEDSDLADSFRTPPGSRAPLRGVVEQTSPTSANKTTAKRPIDPQTLASKIIDFATAGSGQVDPRTEITPEVLSEILSQLQQEPSADDLVDFIRRVRVVSDDRASTKSTERLTTWLGEKRERNRELEEKLAESQREKAKFEGELKALGAKTKEMSRTLKAMYDIVDTLNAKYQQEKELKGVLMQEAAERSSSDVQVLKRALSDSEKQLSDAQLQLSLKRQQTAELELKFSQFQESSTQSAQTDFDDFSTLQRENEKLMREIQTSIERMDELSEENTQSADREKVKSVEKAIEKEEKRREVLKAAVSDIMRTAELALGHKG